MSNSFALNLLHIHFFYILGLKYCTFQPIATLCPLSNIADTQSTKLLCHILNRLFVKSILLFRKAYGKHQPERQG